MQKHANIPKLTQGNESSVEPRIVFFSGGSALKKTSQQLSSSTKNSVHIITTFDSGGSSGFLRQAFPVPAVGDLRNRLLALANRSTIPDSMINFMNFRLPAHSDQMQLKNQLGSFCKKNNELWQMLPPHIYRKFASLIDQILPYIPNNFNYTKLCIGNLLITSHYLYNSTNLYKTIEFFSELFDINGIIIPISESNLHIAAKLTNNHLILGQHRLKQYGKYIDSIFLTSDVPCYSDTDVNYDNHDKDIIHHVIPIINRTISEQLCNADIICYPMGSFYSSLIANLIPSGISECIRNAKCKKVFIPNTGYDPEIDNKSILDQVKIILQTVSHDLQAVPVTQFVSTLLLDLKNGKYHFSYNDELQQLAKCGIEIIDTDICSDTHPNTHNPYNLIKQLNMLASCQ